MKEQPSCAERVQARFDSRIDDLRKLWEAPEHYVEEIGNLYNYGLSLDVVEPGTFEGQRERYIRYQLSWGGPSDEFRIYENGDVEYWFLDWGDGASLDVTGADAELIVEVVTLGESLESTFNRMREK
jgi:hypothetical protein